MTVMWVLMNWRLSDVLFALILEREENWCTGGKPLKHRRDSLSGERHNVHANRLRHLCLSKCSCDVKLKNLQANSYRPLCKAGRTRCDFSWAEFNRSHANVITNQFDIA